MEKIIIEVISYILASAVVIEIAPIRISPLKWIGKRLNGETLDRIDKLEKQFLDAQVDSMRAEILSFANSCKQGKLHTFEEWEHVIEVLEKYERTCIENKIKNDKFPHNARYLRELYQKLSIDGRFSVDKQTGELLKIK